MKLSQYIALVVVSITGVVSVVAGYAAQSDQANTTDSIYLASRDDDDRRSSGSARYRADVEPVSNPQYEQECGACHFAYQPGLLPEAAWRKMMDNLANHFGENAELSNEAKAALLEYMTKNAADNSSYRLSKRVMRSLKGRVPDRIMDVKFIKHEHNEIPKRVFKQKPDLRLSDCQACHRDAKMGLYDEHGVIIPGQGRWDD